MAYTEGTVQRDWAWERALKKSQEYERVIKDVSYSFAANPLTKDVLIKDNNESIVQGIKFLLKTRFFEVPFKPEFYCDIQSFLFEHINEITAEAIKTAINDAIDTNASDVVEIREINVIPRENENGYEIIIIVSPINQLNTITITEFLEIE